MFPVAILAEPPSRAADATPVSVGTYQQHLLRLENAQFGSSLAPALEYLVGLRCKADMGCVLMWETHIRHVTAEPGSCPTGYDDKH